MLNSPEFGTQPEISEEGIIQYLQNQTKNDINNVNSDGESLYNKGIAELFLGNPDEVLKYLEYDLEEQKDLSEIILNPKSEEYSVQQQEQMAEYNKKMLLKIGQYISFLKQKYNR